MEKIYPYAVGRIRAIENSLLNKTILYQMVEAQSIESIFNLLQENGYPVSLAKNVQDFEVVLKAVREDLYRTIQELVPDERFTDLFLLKIDYMNIKTILKGQFTNKDYQNYLMDGGTIPKKQMEEIMRQKEYDKLPKNMQKAIQEAIQNYQKQSDGQSLDIVLDKYSFIHAKELAKESKNHFLIEYVEKLSDLTNLKTFFRILKGTNNFELFERAFLPSGTISLEKFSKAFAREEPYEELKDTPYREIFNRYLEGKSWLFDKLSDNYMMDYVHEAKYEILTVNPLVAYVYAKETEIKNIRIIMTGRLNKIEEEQIKERLREVYV